METGRVRDPPTQLSRPLGGNATLFPELLWGLEPGA
jgi:hypothetical protein